MICAREGCTKQALEDEFCSTACCKVVHGVMTEGELIHSLKYRKEKGAIGPAYVVNPHRNIDRHQGPQLRAKATRRLRG